MTVKVVTDSFSDIPTSVAQELGIIIVPHYVHFGTEEYRDGVDLTTEEFYHKLISTSIHPLTSVAPPAVFAEVYNKLAEETDEIVSISLSPKFGAVYNNALAAKDMMRKRCRIEVIDSRNGIMAEGFIAIAAARAAQAGANLNEVVDIVHQTIPRVHVRIVFDTLEYLRRGGRIGRAQALLGSLLKINPILGIKDGEAYPFGRVRSRAKAIEYLYNFATSFTHIAGLAIEDATTPEEVEKLAERLGSVFPKERIYRSKVSPVVGTHVGPHVLAVTVLEGET